MLFNSYQYIFFFLPATLFIYFFLLNYRLIIAAKGFLVFASLFFYCSWDVDYLPLILISILINFLIGTSFNRIESLNAKKFLLAFGIVSNLLVLGYFKYSYFVVENMNFILGSQVHMAQLILPLGISFFTFQKIAYLVDSFQGKTKEYDFLNFSLFVVFFPQLVAGPIVHHKEVMPQFFRVRNLVPSDRNIALGIYLFCIGLFKKVILADSFASWATFGFQYPAQINLIEAWITSLSYTFQLYFDFSGYTDMAIGAALMFNIRLPINFNSPYKALSIQDFWRRWHITLSRFLRDYIYIPLGGNRVVTPLVYANLMITFLIGGLWHGAAWTFIFWGFLHGFALAIHRLWSRFGFEMWNWASWILTFIFVNLAWVFFRATSFTDAIRIIQTMFSLEKLVLPGRFELMGLGFLKKYGTVFSNQVVFINGDEYTEILKKISSVESMSSSFLWIAFGLVVCLACKNSMEILETVQFNFRTAVITSLLFILSVISIGAAPSVFLYFNF